MLRSLTLAGQIQLPNGIDFSRNSSLEELDIGLSITSTNLLQPWPFARLPLSLRQLSLPCLSPERGAQLLSALASCSSLTLLSFSNIEDDEDDVSETDGCVCFVTMHAVMATHELDEFGIHSFGTHCHVNVALAPPSLEAKPEKNYTRLVGAETIYHLSQLWDWHRHVHHTAPTIRRFQPYLSNASRHLYYTARQSTLVQRRWWQRLAFLIAFVRANRGHPFQSSSLSLVSTMDRLIFS
jgi:hypothetical protein